MDNLDNLEKKCASVRKFFLELSRKKPDDGSTESSSFPEEIVILTGVLNERYRKFREEERKVNLFIRLIRGKLIAYDMPSSVHSSVQFSTGMMMTWHPQLDIHTEFDLTIDENEYCADIAVIPAGDGLNPTMIVEVGVSESLQSLHDLAKSYFSEQTDIKVYLALKFWPLRQDGTAAMIALLYLRENRI